MKSYVICGLRVNADFRHEIMVSRSEKYTAEENADADITINYSPEAIKQYLASAPHLSEAEAELMYTARLFYTALLSFGGFMLHSSAVEMDGKAYLFSAPSGTGKSTHTGLWLKAFGEKAHIINDDKPAIYIRESGIFACGTPWSGKSDLNINTAVPLQGICVLTRSETNHIKPLDEGEAIFSLLNQTLRPYSEKDMDKLLSLLDKVIKNVPVWKMGCNISEEAVAVAFEAMSK
ncbi:MAG: hypothetical protein IJZ65_01965 [Ruminiclostridium sp.]|nr:hypothetical protein [Ruminiclostridium sp.]